MTSSPPGPDAFPRRATGPAGPELAVVLLVVAAGACGDGGGPLPAPPDAGERARTCEGLRNSAECAKAVERRQLGRTGDDVRRTEQGLSLALAAGERLLVEDDTLAEWPTFYRYLGFLSPPGYYVLHAQHPEGADVRIVDRTTGWSRVLSAVPRPSPDGRRVALASGGAYSPNSIRIYRVAAGTLAAEWGTAPDAPWKPDEVVWQDTAVLELARRFSVACRRGDEVAPTYETFRDTARVWRDDEGWRIDTASIRSRIDSLESADTARSCRPAYHP